MGTGTRFWCAGIVAGLLLAACAESGAGGAGGGVGNATETESETGLSPVLAEAIDATLAAGTARFEGSVTVPSKRYGYSPNSLDGDVDFASQQVLLRVDMRQGEYHLGAAQVVTSPSGVYLMVPPAATRGLGNVLTSRKKWIRVAPEMWLPAADKIEMLRELTHTPPNLLEVLRATTELEERETRGVKGKLATLYSGVVDEARLSAHAAAYLRLHRPENSDDPVLVDVSVDPQGRLEFAGLAIFDGPVPTEGGKFQPPLFSIHLSLSDFGDDLEVDDPQAKDVADVTKALRDF